MKRNKYAMIPSTYLLSAWYNHDPLCCSCFSILYFFVAWVRGKIHTNQPTTTNEKEEWELVAKGWKINNKITLRFQTYLPCGTIRSTALTWRHSNQPAIRDDDNSRGSWGNVKSMGRRLKNLNQILWQWDSKWYYYFKDGVLSGEHVAPVEHVRHPSDSHGCVTPWPRISNSNFWQFLISDTNEMGYWQNYSNYSNYSNYIITVSNYIITVSNSISSTKLWLSMMLLIPLL